MIDIKHFQRVQLGFLPTPFTPLSRLSAQLGAQIYIKRDDQTGLGLGGNKTRKLEYLVADALHKGCDTIITAGAAQSNHCRQTAAAAASLGLECHLVLGGEAPQASNGNLLLDQLFNAQLHWAGEHRKGEGIPALFEQLQDKGKKPYLIPYGGSNEIGALGYVQAINELDEQLNGLELDKIIFASSSGGTHAGMMVGQVANKHNYDVIGINIDKDTNNNKPFEENVVTIANKTSDLIGLDYTFDGNDVILNQNYLGQGYGKVGSLEKQAISMLAKSEGILVDPVYTARAFGGMIDMIKNNEIASSEKVLFWHTGGAPALFAYADEL